MNRTRAPALSLRGIRKTYGSGAGEVRALDGVDLDLPPGSFVSVEGPSGCGKTTLLNLLGLLDVPSEGTVAWDGAPVGSLPERERARRRLTGVGFIFQRFYLLPTLTAEENVALPMRGADRKAADRTTRARALLDSVGLSGRRASRPHQLSGGEEQRVAIARALANEPGLLLADEPTGELDRANTESVLDLLVEAQHSTGSTLVLVTHNPAVARRANRHLTMADGRIVSDVREP
ncbi:MAG: ABC transporter ATP-binding protein [Thermoplasmata archaeon]|nr:ABC transporter ATP-binding protein [Thermoplasmata archaeon]MCI4333221.1 ABC transporter ATP-binding protein [Thermoplasmata archaeon]